MPFCFCRWRLLLLAAGFNAQLALAQAPNAWQINDNTTAGGLLQYQTNLTAAQVSSAMTNGWRYELRSRMVSDSGSAAAHSMAFGNGVRRFYIFFDLSGAGDLTAELLGDSTYILTNNPAWVATDYHSHQMTYDPVTSNATYRVDNVVIASWPGQVSVGQSNQVMWGANASAGQGLMNYHRAEFEITGQGIIASYNAGTNGIPAVAPSPTNQAWLRFASGSLLEAALSPDPDYLPAEFVLESIPGLTNLARSSVAWGDYDNDGRLDFLLTGSTTPHLPFSGIPPVSQLWRNTVNGFSNVTASVASGLPGVADGSVAWGDYDNDGRLDFLITGRSGSSSRIAQLWRNTGSGFTNVTASLVPGLTPVQNSAVAWGDYDNDGRLDFLFTGATNTTSGLSQLWRNTGNGFTNATATVTPGLPGFFDGAVAWADFDDDGRLDLLLTGTTNGTAGVSQLWRNTGGGFTEVTAMIAPGLPGVAQSSVAWGDFDNDGRLDFLLTGATNVATGLSQLWQNTGSGFSNVTASVAPGLPGLFDGSAAWADYDSDGRLDFLLTGRALAGGSATSQLWRNTGGSFVNMPIPGLQGVYGSSVAWGDFNNDQRLDFLLTGGTWIESVLTVSIRTELWRNNQPASNSPPTTPTGLSIAPAGALASLTWTASSDAQTPVAVLSYNLRVGTSPGAGDVVSPQSLANGYRLGPGLGNVGSGTNRLVPVQFGVTHYWSVQTVDNGFAASAFAPEQSFTMNSVLTPPGGVPVPGDSDGDGIVSESELNAVLASYFPTSPWLHLTNVAGLGGTNVTFALTNSFAGAFSVEYTTNLADWLPLGPATPRYEFTDTNAPTAPQRSYRLRWP